jgi:hypothetical protein
MIETDPDQVPGTEPEPPMPPPSEPSEPTA